MNEPKRSYYRNWYQHWEEEKKQEEKNQAMKYFSEVDELGPGVSHAGAGQLYFRQGQIYQKGMEAPKRGGHPEGTQPVMDEHEGYFQQGQHFQSFEEEPENGYGPVHLNKNHSNASKRVFSKKQMRQFQDIFRGLIVGLPVVFVLLAILYGTGLIPQENLSRLFQRNDPAIVLYMQNHDQLMAAHNEFNQLIANHVVNGTLSPEVAASLQVDYNQIQLDTQSLMLEHSEKADMTRLWNFKLQSLGQMMTALMTQQQVNEEVIATFNQFVSDQNDIGAEFSRSLSVLLDENNIRFNQLPGGGLSIN